jgi:glycosyltransferase involved in cell wall biosynthesis
MPNILYVTLVDCLNDLGVFKKIESQKKAMESYGYNVDMTWFNGNELLLNGNVIESINRNIFYKFFSRFTYPTALSDISNRNDYDIVYIRKSHINKPFINFLKLNREQGRKVYLEIPTYPYVRELSGLLKKILYINEAFFSFFLKNFIDSIFYFGEAKGDIWGIRSIQLENGVTIERLESNRTIVKSPTDVVSFLGIANISKWHGYDRVLVSIDEYLSKRTEVDKDIIFHIVGEGSELETLKKIVDNLNLHDNVVFHGLKYGHELDDIYARVDIAIDAMAMFRKGMNQTSSLKTREYCARGIPFITACNDKSFPSHLDFRLQLPNDETHINFLKVLAWYKNLDSNSYDISKYAYERLTWNKMMLKVKSEFQK